MAWTKRFCSVTASFFLRLDPDASRKSCRCGCPGPGALRGAGEVELLEYLSEQIRDEVERSLKAEGLT